VDAVTPCATPVSFLRLERFVLGELDAALDGAVREHVASCGFCGAHLEQIREDGWRLDPLPERQGRRRWAVWMGALAAAVALFAIAVPWDEGAQVAVKGGELALTLVRERNGDVVRAPTSYEDGDRFEARLTCASGNADVELAVHQDGRTYLPLGERTSVVCGNDVPLGAFALTGPGDAEVCVTLGAERRCVVLADGG
jgi:hypothetical protein